MFCMNCGTKLPDNAKFCYQCGEKTNVGGEQNSAQEVKSSAPIPDSEKKVDEKSIACVENKEQISSNSTNVAINNFPTKNSEPPENDGMDFVVLGNNVHLSNKDLQIDVLQSSFVELANEKAEEALSEFVESFADVDDLSSVETLFATIAGNNCKTAINLAFSKLFEFGIETYTKDRYYDMLTTKVYNSSSLKSIRQGKQNIEEMEARLAYEKEMNKANWVGGGFGLSGAISGAVKAKALNMAQDGLTSLGKSITGNSDSARLRRYADSQMGSGNTYATDLYNLVYSFIRFDLPEDILALIDKHNKILPQQYYLYSSQGLTNKRKNIKELLKTFQLTKENAIAKLCDCLSQTHNRINFYEDIMDLDIRAYEGLSEIAKIDGFLKELTEYYFKKNENDLEEQLKPYDESVIESCDDKAATQLDLKAIILKIKSNAEHNAFSDEDPEEYTIGLADNNFIVDPAVIHNELAFTKAELVFKGLGDDARVYVKSDEPLPKKYGNFITFRNVKFDEKYRNLINSASSELKTLSDEAIDAGDIEKAIEYLKQMSQMGNDEATFKVANLYLNNLDDKENALDYFEKCPDNNVEALIQRAKIQKEEYNKIEEYDTLMERAADIYISEADEAEEEGDYLTYLNRLEKAAQCNSGDACYRLGELYEEGEHVGLDYQKAIEYYQKGIEFKNSEAQSRLASLYVKLGSECEETDTTKAIEYYKNSIRLESSEAREKLSNLYLTLGSEYESGKNGPSDYYAALKYYRNAAEMDNSKAMVKLADLYANKSLAGIYNYSSAMTWYIKADTCENTQEAMQKLRIEGELTDRLSFFATFYAPKYEGSYYYFSSSISDGTFENADKSYANQFSVKKSDALILYDATRSFLFGIGKKGFIITKDGYIITSQKLKISLYNVKSLDYVSGNKLVVLPSNEVILETKKVEARDRDFIYAFNNEVLCGKAIADNTFTSNNRLVESNVNYYTEGNKYLHGEGVPPDPKEALKLFEIGAMQGDKLCQYNLGYIYSSNLLGTPNYAKCKYWFTKAADNGVAEAKQYLEENRDFFATINCTGVENMVSRNMVENRNNSVSAMSQTQSRQISQQNFIQLRNAFSESYAKSISGSFMTLDLISSKKAKNVVNSYAKNLGIKEEDIKVLVDATTFGNAKDGFIMTDYCIMGSKMKEPIMLDVINCLSVETKEDEVKSSIYAEPMHQLITHITEFDTRVFIDKLNQCVFKTVESPVDEQIFIKLKESFDRPFWKKVGEEFGVLDLISSDKVNKALSKSDDLLINIRDVRVLIYESNFTTDDTWLILTNYYIKGSNSHETIPLNQISYLSLDSVLGSYDVYAEPMHVNIAEIKEEPQSDTIIKKINKFIFNYPSSNTGTKCPFCGNLLVEGALFCDNCGKKLEMKCPNCGAYLELGKDNYCDQCGMKFSFCPYCHEILYAGQSFCTNCGRKL